ncbi:hypothetical protein J8L70_01415 [Pseudoalteromonas sp. MMG010]|uniref:hypothetical protein n=1 Tax=Pseudoalteromonas sp. MMG010 TaxID=2822685 RepID=UPI001B3A1C0C|nr:hypothetical protein [Pseudoalteromonas sp. MMG010]MBQ4831891.1 hypothetical protein [Pseudoalteromonas sp. MMG010]
MRQPIFTLLILLSLLFTTVSQSMAAQGLLLSADIAFDLQSGRAHSDTVNETLSNDETLNSNENSNSDDCCDVPCCENECICAANSCLLTLYLHPALLNSTILIQAESTLEHRVSFPRTRVASLFRPPILPFEYAVS